MFHKIFHFLLLIFCLILDGLNIKLHVTNCFYQYNNLIVAGFDLVIRDTYFTILVIKVVTNYILENIFHGSYGSTKLFSHVIISKPFLSVISRLLRRDNLSFRRICSLTYCSARKTFHKTMQFFK